VACTLSAKMAKFVSIENLQEYGKHHDRNYF